MASYQGHLSVSSMVGAAYGMAGVWVWGFDWGTVFLGAGIATLGGLLPDLDSDSGVPVRELFGLAAAATPVLLFRRVACFGFSFEQTLVILSGVYLLIRYGFSRVFKKFTVHRGMFHSIPAMFIAGLAVYHAYNWTPEDRFARVWDPPHNSVRVYLAIGTMLGFLSHLILDELYSVDFNGLQIKLNKYAGSALKFFSSSWVANAVCYLILGALGFLAWFEWPDSGLTMNE
ncbi:MAG: metal-dependent hydrolase [Gemmataceae bacterium]